MLCHASVREKFRKTGQRHVLSVSGRKRHRRRKRSGCRSCSPAGYLAREKLPPGELRYRGVSGTGNGKAQAPYSETRSGFGGRICAVERRADRMNGTTPVTVWSPWNVTAALSCGSRFSKPHVHPEPFHHRLRRTNGNEGVHRPLKAGSAGPFQNTLRDPTGSRPEK